MRYEPNCKSTYRRFAICYLGILEMILIALAFSVAQGAN